MQKVATKYKLNRPIWNQTIITFCIFPHLFLSLYSVPWLVPIGMKKKKGWILNSFYISHSFGCIKDNLISQL